MLIYCKLLQRNYQVKLLEKTFNRFLCHHSDTLLKYGPNIQDLLYVCLNFKTSNEHSVVDHCTRGNVTYRSTYITSRIPVPLINLGSTCYLNSILQVLFQFNTFVSFDTWINHLLVVDKLSCADNLQLRAFYKCLFMVFIEFNLIVNFVKTITFLTKIFIIFLYSLIQIFLLVLSIIKWITRKRFSEKKK